MLWENTRKFWCLFIFSIFFIQRSFYMKPYISCFSLVFSHTYPLQVTILWIDHSSYPSFFQPFFFQICNGFFFNQSLSSIFLFHPSTKVWGLPQFQRRRHPQKLYWSSSRGASSMWNQHFHRWPTQERRTNIFSTPTGNWRIKVFHHHFLRTLCFFKLVFGWTYKDSWVCQSGGTYSFSGFL